MKAFLIGWMLGFFAGFLIMSVASANGDGYAPGSDWRCNSTKCALFLAIPTTGLFIIPSQIEQTIIDRYIASLKQA